MKIDLEAIKARVFIINDDLLTLQTCCDKLNVRLTIGGPPDATHRLTGFERKPPEEQLKNSQVNWSVVYLECSNDQLPFAVRSLFRAALGEENFNPIQAPSQD